MEKLNMKFVWAKWRKLRRRACLDPEGGSRALARLRPLLLDVVLEVLWAWLGLPQSLMTTQEHLTILRASPSLSILQRPAHSPNFCPSSTVIRGMPCSMHRALISFL